MVYGYVDVDRGRIYQETDGKGDHITMLHAGFLDRRMWDEQFMLLKQRYQVTRYDQRGYGKSSVPEGKFSSANDLKSLLDSLGVKKTILMGVSNGGRICIDFALKFPGYVMAMILSDTGVTGYTTFNQEEDRLWDFLFDFEEEQREHVKKGELKEAVLMDIDLWVPALSGKEWEKVMDIALENKQHLLYDFSSLEMDNEMNSFEHLGEIKVPTLVIVGEEDLDGAIAESRRIQERIPGSELVVIEGGDHIPSLSRPEKFNSILEKFLSKLKK